MPGLVIFKRRWLVGSDDLVVPGTIFLTVHLLCLILLIISLTTVDYKNISGSNQMLLYHQFGYLIILSLSVCIELAICIVSMKGSILDTAHRTVMIPLVYIKFVILLADITWIVLGTWAVVICYMSHDVTKSKHYVLSIVIINWTLAMFTFVYIWCSYDRAGRSWVKLKNYQTSIAEGHTRLPRLDIRGYRHWRQRKITLVNQERWTQRCRLIFCCVNVTERSNNTFSDLARLLADFFRDLDLVSTDVVAGLILLRKFQRLEREFIIRQNKNGVYDFLSGAPITKKTKFLSMNDPKEYNLFQTVVHYMYFAMGAYGWPLYIYQHHIYKAHPILCALRCCGCCRNHFDEEDAGVKIIEDNCCYCNYAALQKQLEITEVDVIYATYHLEINETPFFVAIDYKKRKIVITIRGTLSMKDGLTDLNADSEILPLNPPRNDWLGHKGMIHAAVYIREKLVSENILKKAYNKDRVRNTHKFGLVIVGHSLGAGTAAILGILMRPNYPSLECFCYSPPGGLLSMPVVEYTKSFITSVVLGKDLVPRIGIHQLESLRSDVMNVLKRNVDPKWKTIACSFPCCCCASEPTSVIQAAAIDDNINKYQEDKKAGRLPPQHTHSGSTSSLIMHDPLYPPGRIIHIVRRHLKKYSFSPRDTIYQAIWAETTDFDELIISPVMLLDHLPDVVMAALQKVKLDDDNHDISLSS